MSHLLHSLARTTPKTRAEIRASQRELMKRYSVSKATIIKWHKREDVEDVRIGHTPRTPPFPPHRN
jgi:DNA-binding XRE family transcriptional regulator